MERHNTHLLSCSSSIEHSYIFDKNGNMLSDSASGGIYNNYAIKKKSKINASDIFNTLIKNTKDDLLSQEFLLNQEENLPIKKKLPSPKGSIFGDDNNNDDKEVNQEINENNNNQNKNEENKENPQFKGDKENNKLNNNQVKEYDPKKIIISTDRFSYFPSENGFQNYNQEAEELLKSILQKNENNNNPENKDNNQELDNSLKKYDNNMLEINSVKSIFINPINGSFISEKEKEKENNSPIDNKLKENDSPIDNKLKENDTILGKTIITKNIKLPLNERCFFIKNSSLMIKYKNKKYKQILYIVRNLRCFFTKELNNTEKSNNKLSTEKKEEKPEKTKESNISDKTNNKKKQPDRLINNKYKINDKDKNKNKTINKEDNNKNRIYAIDKKDKRNNKSKDNNLDDAMKKKRSIIFKKNNNEYNEDTNKEDDDLLKKSSDKIKKSSDSNNLNKSKNKKNKKTNENEKENNEKGDGYEDTVNLGTNKKKYNFPKINKVTNLEHKTINKNNNNKGNKISPKKKKNKNLNNFDELSKIKQMLNNNDSNEITKKLISNQLITPRKGIYNPNYHILKPINNLKRDNKALNKSFSSHSKKKKKSSNSKKKSNSKTTTKMTGITTPSKLTYKKLFYETNLSKIRKLNLKDDKIGNRSLLNKIHKNNSNIEPSSIFKEDNPNRTNCTHIHYEVSPNSKKKYAIHFGLEENCPICVAMEKKNKLMEEKTMMLPMLTKANIKKHFEMTKKSSPNKEKIMKTYCPKNKEKKVIRIGSGNYALNMRINNRRKLGSVKQIRAIDVTNHLYNQNQMGDDIFPIIKAYFNEKI